MNFGALQCMPLNPKCISCTLAAKCIAFQSGRVAELPVKKTRIARKKRYFHYFLFLDKRGLVLQQRLHKDIWQHMFDFPLIETSSSRIPSPSVMMNLMKMHAVSKNGYHRVHKETQVLTHQTVHCTFYIVDCRAIDPKKLPLGSQYAIFKNLKTFAFPKIIRSFFSHSLRNKLPQGFKHG
jgi:A/G-specific adenine glycosylase